MKPYQRRALAKWRAKMGQMVERLKKKGYDTDEPIPAT